MSTKESDAPRQEHIIHAEMIPEAAQGTSLLDRPAIVLGCAADVCVGLLFGGVIALLIDASLPELRAVVILHSALAATLTGGWTAPCVLTPDP